MMTEADVYADRIYFEGSFTDTFLSSVYYRFSRTDMLIIYSKYSCKENVRH